METTKPQTKLRPIWNNQLGTFVPDSNYPNFKPAMYITFLSSGYLNGGYYVKAGTIAKYMGQGSDMWLKYQGFYEQEQLQYSKVNVFDDDIVHKEIASVSQYIKIEGNWFRKSTQSEIDQFEGWLKAITEANPVTV